MMGEEELISNHIGHRVGKQGPQYSAGNQAEVEKLENGIGTDSHGNDQDINNGNLNQIIRVGIPPKETTATARQRNLLVEVKTDIFYGLRTIAKKVKKYGQVKNLALN